MAEAEIREVHVERYYPSVLANAREFAAIAEAENPELRALWQVAWKWYLNTFVYDFDIAGAARWEQMLSLRPKSDESLDARRRRILAKINAVLPYTFRRLEEMLDAMCGAESYSLAVDYGKRELYFNADPDVAGGLNQVSKLLRAVVPANLALYIVMLIMQEWAIKHAANVMQFSNAKHCVWNQGTAQTTRWDGTYCLDGTIRLDGIYGADYREHQHHIVEIWYSVEAVQRNLIPVNVWDGSFCLDGSHTLCGMSLQRPPISKTIIDMFSTATMWINHKRICQSWPHVEAYLPNFVMLGSNNMQHAASPQTVEPRQCSAVIGQTEVTQRHTWSYVVAEKAQTESTQTAQIHQEIQSTQQTAARQAAGHDHTSTQTGQSAAHQAQTIRQPTAQTSSVAAREQINIESAGNGTNQVIAQHITDYRACNLWDGSFCLDGSHALDGMVRSVAHIGHLCTVATLTKNGKERIERV